MQALILQTFRFLGSIFFEPIMRIMLYLIARCSHFKAIEIGNWSFWGPPSFLKLAEEAAEYLKAEGSKILGGAPPKFDVMYGWSEFGAAPAWRNAFISDAYIAWGAQGILTAWVYIYFTYVCRPKTRWLWAIGQRSIQSGEDAKAKTREWLQARDFPKELWEGFQAKNSVASDRS